MKMMKRFYPNQVRTLLKFVIAMTGVMILSTEYLNAAGKGGIDSGGGGVFDCQDGKTYLLDLVNAGNVYVNNPTLKINSSNMSVETQLRNALAKLERFDSALPDLVYQTAQTLFKNKVSVPFDENAKPPVRFELEPPRDSLSNYRKIGCVPKGMMWYDGNIQRLVVDDEKFDRLESKTHVAASMVHEAWYLLARSRPEGAKDSVRTQKLVACLFSTNPNCLTTDYNDNFSSAKRMAALYKNSTHLGPKFKCSNENYELSIDTAMSFSYGLNETVMDAYSTRFNRVKNRVFPHGALIENNYIYIAADYDYAYQLPEDLKFSTAFNLGKAEITIKSKQNADAPAEIVNCSPVE